MDLSRSAIVLLSMLDSLHGEDLNSIGARSRVHVRGEIRKDAPEMVFRFNNGDESFLDKLSRACCASVHWRIDFVLHVVPPYSSS